MAITFLGASAKDNYYDTTPRFILLNDGVSKILLNDGSSKLKLNDLQVWGATGLAYGGEPDFVWPGTDCVLCSVWEVYGTDTGASGGHDYLNKELADYGFYWDDTGSGVLQDLTPIGAANYPEAGIRQQFFYLLNPEPYQGIFYFDNYDTGHSLSAGAMHIQSMCFSGLTSPTLDAQGMDTGAAGDTGASVDIVTTAETAIYASRFFYTAFAALTPKSQTLITDTGNVGSVGLGIAGTFGHRISNAETVTIDLDDLFAASWPSSPLAVIAVRNSGAAVANQRGILTRPKLIIPQLTRGLIIR